jgi:hypothetical protein
MRCCGWLALFGTMAAMVAAGAIDDKKAIQNIFRSLVVLITSAHKKLKICIRI